MSARASKACIRSTLVINSYTRHRSTCAYCSGDGADAVEAQREAEKENRFVQLEIDEKGRFLATHRMAVSLLCEVS